MVRRFCIPALGGLILAACALGNARVPSSQPTEKKAAPYAEIERRIVGYTNTFRQKKSRGQLTVDEHLTAAAREFAEYIAEHGKMDHRADERTPSERVLAQGYKAVLVGENLACFTSTGNESDSRLAGRFVKQWQDSPGHRRNMLRSELTQIGVGVARSRKTGRYYAVQVFAKPAPVPTTAPASEKEDD